MMSGMEPIIMGAVAGAALNRDDPMKGAMLGAALGGGAGSLLGGAAAAEAGALGAAELGAAEGAMSLARPDVAPVLSDYITQAQAAGQVPMAGYQVQPIVQLPTFDYDAIARASLGSDIPGASAVAGSSPMAARFNPMQGMSAMNMLSQAQARAAMQAPGIRRGQPQAVNYGGLASLLEPKLVERRRLSLL
jgi:hypothetical protein